uniref:Uncharacterized protein n=1 Tax=Trypanosoma vivax (strain Y486) TaxID=1055687 RepID=G0TUL1_TRYVY|nr:hypothetical protein, unlikely [Trypanosoma vivax Y486]
MHMHVYIYIYVRMYVCACICIHFPPHSSMPLPLPHVMTSLIKRTSQFSISIPLFPPFHACAKGREFSAGPNSPARAPPHCYTRNNDKWALCETGDISGDF